jgi:hypothetical protein
MTASREILTAYDALVESLEALVAVCDRNPGGPQPVELISEAAALVLQAHGQGDGSAFPRFLAAEAMATAPGVPPVFHDVTHGSRLRRSVAAEVA